MNPATINPAAPRNPSDQLLSLTRHLLDLPCGIPHWPPPPPGPWDWAFRDAVRYWLTTAFLHSNPGPWDWIHPHSQRVFGPEDSLAKMALNPQPLPPRRHLIMAIVRAFLARAEVLHEFASASASESEKRGIIIVSGYVQRFVAALIAPGFKMPLRPVAKALSSGVRSGFLALDEGDDWLCPIPFDLLVWLSLHRPPPPAPPQWLDEWLHEELSGSDLLVLGASFSAAAQRAFDPAAADVYASAARQLAEAGTSRLA